MVKKIGDRNPSPGVYRGLHGSRGWEEPQSRQDAKHFVVKIPRPFPQRNDVYPSSGLGAPNPGQRIASSTPGRSARCSKGSRATESCGLIEIAGICLPPFSTLDFQEISRQSDQVLARPLGMFRKPLLKYLDHTTPPLRHITLLGKERCSP